MTALPKSDILSNPNPQRTGILTTSFTSPTEMDVSPLHWQGEWVLPDVSLHNASSVFNLASFSTKGPTVSATGFCCSLV